MKNISDRAVQGPGRVRAVLGPTNTGKTHLAVERMMGHHSGMIGLPLRLLAREIYDRIVKSPQNPAGRNGVALITGEEKIIPPHPRWWVCTVESMPVTKTVAFLAVDEIQLAADPGRGHIFTDRLLRARGTAETMFLGSDNIAPLLRRLLPGVEISSRPRFSRLTYSAPKKLKHLQPRTALVTFSAHNVYGYAEMLRRQKGGVAVVMGSLSPRTRNKQVALYQNGDVDFLVATDAIGMGLNMDIDHVCFAATSKFDGRRLRSLSPAEIAQIAGRAGRHMNDGSFGCLVDGSDSTPDLTDEMIYAVENHSFPPLRVLEWRNSLLDYHHPSALIRSLEVAPERKGLTRCPENSDLASLRKMLDTADIRALASGPAALKTLWDICQIPDFRKNSDDQHFALLSTIYRQISAENGVLDPDWLTRHITPLDRTVGDVDALSTRISHIRTWTYISHHAPWFDEAKYWQEMTRDIEDRLSDALHQRLTDRFVDRRMSHLMRELRQKGQLMTNMDDGGNIYAEDHLIGTLEGFEFREEAGAFGEDSRILRAAADKILTQEIRSRVEEFTRAEDGELNLILGDPMTRSTITWRGITIARIVKGQDILAPKAVVIPTPLLQGDSLAQVQGRTDRWLVNHIGEILTPLFALKEAVNGAKDGSGHDMIDGMARGIAFQMLEKLGTIPRRMIARDFRDVTSEGRFQMKQLGIWLGAASLYIPALLKPAPAQLRLFLWALFNDRDQLPDRPLAGLCTIAIDPDAPRPFYEVSGYRVVGRNAVRLDMLERLANAAREISLKGPFPADPALMSLVGTSGDDFVEIMKYLGYVYEECSPEEAAKIAESRTEKTEIEKAGTEIPPEKPEPEKPEPKKAEPEKPEPEKAEPEKPEPEKAEPEKAEPENSEPEKPEPETPEPEAPDAEPEKIFLFRHQPHRKTRPDRPVGRKPAHRQKTVREKKPGTGTGARTGNRPGSGRKPPRKTQAPDPHSPFAALAGLKNQLKTKR